MSEGELLIGLVREDPRGYVPLCQLRELFRGRYCRDIKQRKLKKWVASLRGVCIDGYPERDSVRATGPGKDSVRATDPEKDSVRPTEKNHGAPRPPHRAALIRTLESHGGRIHLGGLKRAYLETAKNIPPYPSKGTQKWILSVEGVRIDDGMVQLVRSVPITNPVHRDSCTNENRVPAKMKKKKKKKKKEKEKSAIHTHHQAVPPEKGKRKICIMHFGFTAGGKSLRPKGNGTDPDRGRPRRESKRTRSRAIMSGYLASKCKGAGGAKAARKARNLARLRNARNPPAEPSAHALQRYRERGPSCSPIYVESDDRTRSTIMTYVPIQREKYSQAKYSKEHMLLEVDRMRRSAKISVLPRSKLSSRDAYLLGLSSNAAKKYETRRRSHQREKAYAQRHVPFD